MRWLALLLLAACSGAEHEPPPPEAPASSPEPAAAPSPPVAPARASIGWDHVPRDPAAAARAINRDALRVHGHALGAPEDEARRVYEGSLVAFQRAVEAEPDYLAARFNAACALSRLGRADEAVAILRELLAIDLPSFAPRVDSDPDLGPLSGTPAFAALTAFRAELSAAYDEALAAGVPVVHVTPPETIPAAGEDADAHVRRTMQAGVWLEEERRFVPMAPRLVSEAESLTAGLVLLVQVVDAPHHAVLSLEGEGSWSEGGGPIGAGTFVVFDAGRGTERARFVSGHPAFVPGVEGIAFHATADGGALRFTEETDEGDWIVHTRGAFDAAMRPAIALSLAHASVLLPTWSPSGLEVEGDVARLGAGDARVALPAEHHVGRSMTRFERWAPRDEHSDWLLTAAIEPIEWDSSRAMRPALSFVGVGAGTLTVELVLSARTGVGAILPGAHGAYAQIGDAVYRLTASTSASAPPDALPAGLRLIPSEPHVY